MARFWLACCAATNCWQCTACDADEGDPAATSAGTRTIAAPPAPTTAGIAPLGSQSTSVTNSSTGRDRDSRSDFDLVHSAHGATLIWFEVTEEGSWLYTHDFDRKGQPSGQSQQRARVCSAGQDCFDLNAIDSESGLVAVWMQRESGHTRTWGWRDQSPGGGAPVLLGDSSAADPSQLGNLALAVRGDTVMLLMQGPATPCSGSVQSTGPCLDFSFRRITRLGTFEPTGLVLNVPVPCRHHSVNLISLGSQWHYGVCTEVDGQTVTTVFNITPSPQYAEAFNAMPGCEPRGFIHIDGRPWMLARCGQRLHASRLEPDLPPSQSIELSDASLRCAAGHMRVEASSFVLNLQEPRAHLAALLPGRSDTERAVWTGQVLLEARRGGSEPVTIQRRRCFTDAINTDRVLLPPAHTPLVDAPIAPPTGQHTGQSR